MEPQSIYDLFGQVAAAHPDRVAYRHKRDHRWVDVTWAEQRATAARVSKGLIALGVARGDRVAILSSSRLEWVQADYGIVNRGAVTVGIYPSNLAPECGYILDHSEAVVAFVEDAGQLQKILAVRAELPALRHVIVFDGPADETNDVLSWEDFLDRGNSVSDGDLEEIGRSIRPGDLATLVYTSGTTGVPKGVMLSHDNLLFTTWTAGQCMTIEPDYVTLLFLPLAHVYARLIVYLCLRGAVTLAFAEDISTIPANMKEVRPHFFASVPRIFEKVHERITTSVEEAGGLKRALFRWSIGVGREVSRRSLQKQEIPLLVRLKHAVAQALVLRKIQEAFGGRLVYAVSGAAPLNSSIGEFFHACGVTILEGIGMTENTSFTNVNPLRENRFGTVGPVGPGVEMATASDGEVLFRGRNVMKGYYKDPEATAEAIDDAGWLHTGDIGAIEDGYLRITDRKKDLIITAGGKNVAPQRIERILRTSRFISQVVAYGDQRKFITALVTLEPDNIRQWADANGLAASGIDELARHPQVHELIRREIDERNRELASFETVKRFHILPRDLSIEEGELTPTLKVKRKVVTQRYRDELESLYRE